MELGIQPVKAAIPVAQNSVIAAPATHMSDWGNLLMWVFMSIRLFFNLVADDAANRSTANGSYGATAREDGSADRADAGADCRVLIPRRHSGAGAEREQGGHSQ